MAWGVGAAIVAGGAGIALLNPRLRAGDEAGSGAAGRPRRRQWLGACMIAALTMTFGATMLLSGVDLAIVAMLREAGQVSWAAVVIVVSGMASVVGGLIYGVLPRPLPAWLLLGLLGLVTALAGLAHDWHWLCLAVIGAGILTAPALSAVADSVSRLAPASVRGEAMGLQSSAMSAGVALGSAIAGVAIGLSGPAGGFAAAGLVGLAAALTGCLLSRRVPAATLSPPSSQASPGHRTSSPATPPSGLTREIGRRPGFCGRVARDVFPLGDRRELGSALAPAGGQDPAPARVRS
jgi:predicted MFS family arabinose efflux permease